MSTITTIAASDLITNSRTDINNNFANLNTDKIETSYLDTDTTLAANSDSKIATQKAVKAYVDAGGNVNASTTARGIVEEATVAEIGAGTAAGGTGARLFMNPSSTVSTSAGAGDVGKIPRLNASGKLDGSFSGSCLTLVPFPNGLPLYSETQFATSNSTRFYAGQIVVPVAIVVNKLSFVVTAFGSGAGTIKVALFSEDGQTQIFSITTASISGTGIVSTAVSAVTVNPGVYYLGFVSSNADITLGTWNFSNGTTFSALQIVSGEPYLGMYTACTANTVPTTITPGSGTAGSNTLMAARFDN